MLHLKVKVVLIGIGAKTDLFQDRFLRIGLDFFLLFLLLVLKLGVVDDLAYRRVGIGGNLHQVQALLFRHLDGYRRRVHIYFDIFAHHANAGCDNPLIDSIRFLHNSAATEKGPVGGAVTARKYCHSLGLNSYSIYKMSACSLLKSSLRGGPPMHRGKQGCKYRYYFIFSKSRLHI